MKFKNENEALQVLSRNRIRVDSKTIVVKQNIGLKLLSAVDYLVKFCGYQKK